MEDSEEFEISDGSKTILMEMFDKDGSGYINRHEFEHFLAFMGLVYTEEELEFLGNQFDKNNDGKINMEEFFANMNMICQHSLKSEELMNAFKVIDKNGDGYISERELRALLMSNKKMTRREAADLIDYLQDNYDLNKDGRFDYKEFLLMLNKENDNPFKPRPKTASQERTKMDDLQDRTFVE